MRLFSSAMLVGCLVFAAAACDDEDEGQPIFPEDGGPVGAVRIDVTDNGFVPDEVTIFQGQTVVWTNVGTDDHWVTSGLPNFFATGTEFDAELSPGESFVHTFDGDADWDYYDRSDPENRGEIDVE
jgi:plastocyanin